MPRLKALIKWNEPRAFRRWAAAQISSQSKVRSGLLKFVLGTVGGLVVWFLARASPAKTPPPFAAALVAALCLGAFISLGIPAILWLCPAQVSVYERGVYRTVGNRMQGWNMRDIRSWEVRTIDYEFGQIRILVLEHRSKGRIQLGLPETMSDDRLEAAFAAPGVTIPRANASVRGQ